MLSEHFGFRFEICSVEEMELTSGESAFVVFLKILNLSQKARSINVSKATYVTKDGEQLEQDNWLSGYLIESARIQGDAHRKCGLIFYKRHLSCVATGDSLFIDIQIPDRSKKLSIRFELVKKSWKLTEAHEDDADVPLSPRSLSNRLSKKIETLEVFEERGGVRLEGLSAKVDSPDDTYFEIHGELHPREGVSLTRDIAIVVVAYDSEGKILDSSTHHFFKANFHGFETLKFTECVKPSEIAKIRVYPKAV